MTFTFQSPGKAPPCGDNMMVTSQLLALSYTTEKSHRGKCPNVIIHTARHCGDNQKVLALHHSPAIPLLSQQDNVYFNFTYQISQNKSKYSSMISDCFFFSQLENSLIRDCFFLSSECSNLSLLPIFSNFSLFVLEGIFRASLVPAYYRDKVSKGAKIRNRCNQVPHLTQDTNGKVTNPQ